MKARMSYLIHGALPPFVTSALGRLQANRSLVSYLRSNRRPWRQGYYEYRNSQLRRILYDDAILELFRHGNPLPSGYGFRLDARVVEIPWVLSRLKQRNGYVLDAGSSLNYGFVLKSPALASKRITIVTLAPEAECQWHLGVSYAFGDLRNLDFKDSCFDTVVCISTIEHVGMNNTMYLGTVDETDRGDTKEFLAAVREMARVLKLGGSLYVTLPFGKYEDHGWLQQFDSELTDRLIAEFSPSHLNETIFRYDPDGWKLSDRASCADCAYFDVHASKYFDPTSKTEYPPDYPAAERAVACLELFKC